MAVVDGVWYGGAPTDSRPRGGTNAGWVLLAASEADFATGLNNKGGEPRQGPIEGDPRGIRTLPNNVLRTSS